MSKADSSTKMWEGLTQSVESLHRTKRLTVLGVRQNSSCPIVIDLKHTLFLGVELIDLFTSTITTGLPGSQIFGLNIQAHIRAWIHNLLIHLLILGLVNLYKHVSQFVLLNSVLELTHTHSYVHTRTLSILFVWKTSINTYYEAQNLMRWIARVVKGVLIW